MGVCFKVCLSLFFVGCVVEWEGGRIGMERIRRKAVVERVNVLVKEIAEVIQKEEGGGESGDN